MSCNALTCQTRAWADRLVMLGHHLPAQGSAKAAVRCQSVTPSPEGLWEGLWGNKRNSLSPHNSQTHGYCEQNRQLVFNPSVPQQVHLHSSTPMPHEHTCTSMVNGPGARAGASVDPVVSGNIGTDRWWAGMLIARLDIWALVHTTDVARYP